MSSLWNRSGTIERYADDIRASGAKAYFFLGGTTTPLSVYQDSSENSGHLHPVVADADGRWPDVFVPYIASYDVRVVTAFDEQLTYTLMIPNPSPVEVDVTVDPISTVQTGMIHAEMVNATKAGYVRLNGRTMGNSSSSGTERANDDSEDLFVYLWNNLIDAIAPVSGGRGGSGAADFAANKTIGLPSWQGAVPTGLDDMGAAAGSFFAGLTFSSGSSIIPGSLIGSNSLVIVTANLPAHSHIGTTDTESNHTHVGTTEEENEEHQHSGTTDDSSNDHTHNFSDIADSAGAHTHDVDSTVSSIYGGGGLGAVTNLGGPNVVAGAAQSDGAHTHTVDGTTEGQNTGHVHTFTSGNASQGHEHDFTTQGGSAHSHTFTTGNTGSGVAINNMQRSILVTWFIKL